MTYRMKQADKKVVDAFLMRSPREGKAMYTDGNKIYKRGFVSFTLFARWVGGKVLFVHKFDTVATEVMLRYLVKKAGKSMVRFVEYAKKNHPDPITFDHGGDSLHRGQYDAYVTAKIGDRVIGRIDFYVVTEGLDEGAFKIKMVEVDPEFRRGGIATQMYRYMQKQYKLKSKNEEFGGRTEEGSAFRNNFSFKLARSFKMSQKKIRPKMRDTADHRVIARILELSFGQKAPSKKKLDLCSKVFSNAGGSWYSFFRGDPDHVVLLKRSIKAVILKEMVEEKNGKR